jgi:hypothetical protein
MTKNIAENEHYREAKPHDLIYNPDLSDSEWCHEPTAVAPALDA